MTNPIQERKKIQNVKELQRLCKRQRDQSAMFGDVVEAEVAHGENHPSRPYLMKLMKERNKEIERIIEELE